MSAFTPTGTVTITLYEGNSCTGTLIGTQTSVALGAPSTATTTLAAGSYSYQASAYSGDANYVSGTSSACEPFTVQKATTTISTTLDEGSTPPLGASVSDTATATGVTGFTPTGTMTITLYQGGSCGGTVISTQTLVPLGTASTAQTTLNAGTYSYVATGYSGDTNYVSGTSSACEPFTVQQSTVTINTAVSPSTTPALGASVTDTASASGVAGFAPTGTVTITLYPGESCTGTPVEAQTAVPLGTPSYAQTTLNAGSYSYLATAYSGDTNYVAGTTGACEPFTVQQATATINTLVSPSTTPALGASVTDTPTAAGVTGFTPTGTMTITLYPGSSCSGTPLSTQTLVSLGTPSAAQTTLNAGSYSYLASAYSGDTNYVSGTSSSCEPFTVAKASTTVTTTVEPGASNPLGTAAFDTAAIGGTVTGFAPTGTVTYAFYSASGLCTGPSTTQTVPLRADGRVPNSSSKTLAGGSYSYSAGYSGDSNYNASPTGACELLTITKATATISTTLNAGTNPVLGAAVSDKATATGVTGFAPTGTVMITLYPGSSCTGTAVQTYTGVSLGSSSPNVSPNLASGPYSFQASAYSGDNNYVSGTSGSCEPFAVQTPAQSTSSLISLVNGMNLPHGTTTSLVAKLSAALDSINRGNDNAAMNQLNAFINEVNAQAGKAITQSQAQTLTYDAQAIITALS